MIVACELPLALIVSSPLLTGPNPAKPSPAAGQVGQTAAAGASATDPVLCGHCGRTASNGISCQGICVADSGY
jgi:hypothetical protein